MLTRPKFRPHLRVEVVPGEGVFLLSSGRHVLLRGRLYELLASRLNGQITVDDLCADLHGRASPAEVFFALGQLERKDFLCDGYGGLPEGQAALWSSQKVVPATAAKRLAEKPVCVRGLGVAVGPFSALLGALYVRTTDTGPADVVLTDDYLRDELADVNADALRANRPWLLVKPTGRQVWVGPLFRPGGTGCWACLAERLRANAPVPVYLRERNGHALTPVSDLAHTPATEQVALGLAANAVATWAVRGEVPELEGKVQTLDLPSWKLQDHVLPQLPFCSACGGGAVRSYARPELERRIKTFTNDGGHRSVRPEETIARYAHHVSPLTGALPLLERAATGGGDGVLHVYLAGNNMARPHKKLAHLRGDLRNMSAGKGTSDAQAKASGLCEGLERYSGVFRGDEPRRLARMEELGGAALSLSECLLFSATQYRERAARNATGSRFSFIPEPFDPASEIEWSPVWSLTRGAVRYLPTAFCYYDYPQPPETTYCVADSNGNAAGNTLEEAILQGFLELVERDSVALWWYNRVRRPRVDLASFEEPYIDRLAAFLRERGREFWALDLTSDLGIPVFATVCRRTGAKREQIVLGFGAHLDTRIALLRAVTEMNQMLSSPLLEAGEKDDPHADGETARWLATATATNQPYLVPTDAATTAATYPRAWTDDVREDVEFCRARVEREGLEMLVLDQTRPEVGLPVAKVIVPGLRHFWTRFAPGRLYDVPVRLGWLDRPLGEDELNPIPMFL
ncbi:TOMM precursor leader peptide-binding protein [Frigoriglobus tundricola]|uniref:TOMM biosynthesis cyclodehydratase (Protein C) / TOMM biosynthesis docking scaffold (Protein D) n=1 Tax=Frigoriglobus tundricola TaxID=2774151 RepID=A0A6M5YI80_9BACT|nr:TOMM precursor leader peptide-binding protein [Frigoriglobus tundricola]QJW93688.1 TOMM biosynthesis cyclodehydratase (protein C) / TOMM biosynthesis docking scaffold (protein D) [Frigoriglobus tundricola]